MSGHTFYNEIEPYCVEWLRNLIGAGLISPGDVEPRDIRALDLLDLHGYTQAHFFAGIGLWSHALRLASWPDDVPVWTGSCPCQPFSAAGRRGGFDDDRHLWPVWFSLIRECRPPVVFGEQVASPDGLRWFDLVSADLEGEGYSVGAADLCAAGVGAPHIRQRLFFMAIADGQRLEGLGVQLRERSARQTVSEASRSREAGELGDAGFAGTRRLGGAAPGAQATLTSSRREHRDLGDEPDAPGATSFWADADWLPCRDGRSRPVERGAFPLVDGYPGRVDQVRAYGNAIAPPLAASFIAAAMECM